MSLDPEDPRLAPYRDLQRRGKVLAEGRPVFICEGRYLARMALDEARSGRLQLHSVLGTRQGLSSLDPLLPDPVPRLQGDAADLEAIAGFPFHRGVLLCAYCPAPPPEEQILEADRLVVLPRLDDAENLGLVLRSAAALGMEAVLAGPGPALFQRRTVRVSMGAVFRIPVLRSPDPLALLGTWKRMGGEAVASCLEPGATLVRDWVPAPRTALLLGPEDRGLDPEWLEAADLRVRIPMSRGMDSLNVAAAAAILMSRMME